MDVRHLHAGGVGHRAAHRRQLVVDRLPLSVGADDHSAPRGDLLQGGYAPHPLGLQIGDHMVVVDHRAQHHIGLPALGHLLGQLHCPAHAETEARRLGQDDFSHSAASISARWSRTARMRFMISSVTTS